MKLRASLPLAISTLAILLWPLTAAAHPGHDLGSGFAAGFAHPFSGLDHLVAMFAVGVWAAQLGGRARVLIPAGFVLCMLGGACFGLTQLTVPYTEAFILMSAVALLALIAFTVRVNALLGAALVGVFALFHGYAHAVEMPATAAAVHYIVGFALATLCLHAAGLFVAIGIINRWQAPFLRDTGNP